MPDAVEMNPTQELLARLERLQTEIVEIDGLLRTIIKSKVGGRLIGNLIETVNALESMLMVRP